MKPRIRHARKLLVASLGVAAVNYVQCGGDSDSDTQPKKDAGSDVVVKQDSGSGGTGATGGTSSGGSGGSDLDAVANLVAPDAPEDNTSVFDVVANLVAPDTGLEDQTFIPFDVVANLVAPDAGSD